MTYLSSTSGLLCLSTSWQGKFWYQNKKANHPCYARDELGAAAGAGAGAGASELKQKKNTWRHIAASRVFRMQVRYNRSVLACKKRRSLAFCDLDV
jgi:hypothetical protein